MDNKQLANKYKDNTLKTGDIRTIAGIFKENVIYSGEDERFTCYTYGSVRKQIEGKSGIFNLRYEANVLDWIIFQYVLSDSLHKMVDH